MLDYQLLEFFLIITISLISRWGAFTIDTLSHLWEVLFVSSHVRLIKADTNCGLFATLTGFHESHNNTGLLPLPLVRAISNLFPEE